MSYTIDYSKYSGESRKRKKALSDIHFYLGNKGFRTLIKTLMKVKDPQVALGGCSLLGIHGYPARVIVDRYVGRAQK